MPADFYKHLEIKEVGEDGTFTGIASVYGVEDLGGDVIEKGAFKKTISENPTVPILWQHDRSEVIGQGTVKEWQGKILLNGTLDLDDPIAVKAYKKLKNGLIKGLSIGFQTIKAVWEEVEEESKSTRFVRHITELKLFECSVVTFPMLPDAQVTRVKSAEEWDEIKSTLLEAQKRITDLEALLAAKATAEQSAAGEGIEAATEVPDEPDLHSLADQIKSELKGTLIWR